MSDAKLPTPDEPDNADPPEESKHQPALDDRGRREAALFLAVLVLVACTVVAATADDPSALLYFGLALGAAASFVVAIVSAGWIPPNRRG